MTARFSATDYAAAFRALMPRGRAWSDDPDSVQGRFYLAIAKVFERSDAAAVALLANALPGDNLDLLSEWESSLGLPDPCAGTDPTTVQRADQVRARFTAGGGQSRQRFIDYAARLGFTIRIINYAPFRAGRSTCGNPTASDAWTFVWGVEILANTAGLSVALLACELNAIKPAETTILIPA